MKTQNLNSKNVQLLSVAKKRQLSENVLRQFLIDSDPTPHQEYFSWILRIIKDGSIRLEDGFRVKTSLGNFHRLKQNKALNKLFKTDIFVYKSLHEVEEALDALLHVEKKSICVDPLSLTGVTLEKESENYKLYKITDIDSLAELGEGTKWCTRKSYPNCQAGYYLAQYKKIYIITDKSGKLLYQYTPVFDQFMDVNDQKPKNLNEEIKLLLDPEKDNLNAEHSLFYAKNILKSRFELGEPIIAKNAQYSYQYALNVLNSRFELGEPEIAKNPQWSYYYAKNILKSRFELGEPAIAQNAYYAYYYATNILKSRFELGETAIPKDPEHSYHYAKYILKSRFELGEPTIAQDAYYSYFYATNILKSRFELGEIAIAKDPEHSYLYAKYILKSRFELGEPTIAQDAHYSYYYKKYILKAL